MWGSFNDSSYSKEYIFRSVFLEVKKMCCLVREEKEKDIYIERKKEKKRDREKENKFE